MLQSQPRDFVSVAESLHAEHLEACKFKQEDLEQWSAGFLHQFHFAPFVAEAQCSKSNLV